MLTNSSLLHLPLTPGVGSKGLFVSFVIVVMLPHQINLNEAYNTKRVNVLHFYIPFTPVWGQNVKTFF